MLQVIGTTTSTDQCDCCGKTDLASAVVLQDADGNVYCYGRLCAARATGRKVSSIDHALAFAGEASFGSENDDGPQWAG
jgi:hypothetical protein